MQVNELVPTASFSISWKSYLKNPNLAFAMLPRILQCLPNEALKSCREVHESMKMIMNNPRFWIERFKKAPSLLKWYPQGQQQLQQPPQPFISIENVKKWIKLLALVQKANLVEKFVENLLNCCWYLCDWPIYLQLESGSPIHVAAYTGDVGLMDLILHNNISTY